MQKPNAENTTPQPQIRQDRIDYQPYKTENDPPYPLDRQLPNYFYSTHKPDEYAGQNINKQPANRQPIPPT